MKNRKYCVQLVERNVFSYEVEANDEDEATNKVYSGDVEPYDTEMIEKYVSECYPIEPEEEEKDISTYDGWGEPDTPLEGVGLF